jgi:plastocyanin
MGVYFMYFIKKLWPNLLLIMLAMGIAKYVVAKSPVYEIIIKDHKFIPEKLDVPAGKKIRLLIRNKDFTVEEFESFDLKREKIVPGNGKIKVSIGPLKPGIYKFFGEFHAETAQGEIVAVEGLK